MERMTSIGTKPSFYMFLNLQALPMNVIVYFIARKRKVHVKSDKVKIFIFAAFVARFFQFLWLAMQTFA